jgi:hypothetical protein
MLDPELRTMIGDVKDGAHGSPAFVPNAARRKEHVQTASARRTERNLG